MHLQKRVWAAAWMAALYLTACTGAEDYETLPESRQEMTDGASVEASADEIQQDTQAQPPAAGEETPAAGTDQPDLPQTQEEWVAEGREISCRMAEGDFKTAEERFSDAIAAQLDAAGLEKIYQQAIDGLGGYVRCYGSELTGTEEGYQVETTLEYEETGLIVRLVFADADAVILNKILFDYSSLPKQYIHTDQFEESPVTVGEGDTALDGILTVPVTPLEGGPIAVLVPDSGARDMNETIGAEKNTPFRDIAWDLAEQGIATVRYNNRLFQYGESVDMQELTVGQEVLEDAGAALQLAASYSDSVYLIGHGFGAMLAADIAQGSPHVSGIVMLAGSPRSVAELKKDQILRDYEASGLFEQEDLDMYEDQYELIVQEVLRYTQKDAKKSQMGIYGQYWASINALSLPDAVQKTELPVLLIQGSMDFEVPMGDYQIWNRLLSGKKNVSMRMIGGLNHYFLPYTGKTGSKEYDAKRDVSPDVAEQIGTWISGQKNEEM